MSQHSEVATYVTDGNRLPLGYYAEALRRRWWKIGLVVALGVAAAAVWTNFSPRLYESTVVILLDSRAPSSLIGQGSGFTSLADIDQYIATQVKLIQSDRVLRPVLNKHPLLGAPTELTVPGSAVPTTVGLKGLRVNRPPNTLLMQVSYLSTDSQLAAAVANEVAASYMAEYKEEQTAAQRESAAFLRKQAEALKSEIVQSGAGLVRMEQEMSLINPEQRTSILSTRLTQLSGELANVQADRMQKEAAANQLHSGATEVLEASVQSEALRQCWQQLNDAKRKFVDVQARFGPNYPDYKRAAAQLAEVQQEYDLARETTTRRMDAEFRQAQMREGMLEAELNRVKQEFDRLNQRSFEYQSRKREAEANQKLYDDLVRRSREISINSGYDPSFMRITEPAQASARPVSPDVPMNLALGLLFGIIIAAGGSLTSDLLDSSVRDPEQIGRAWNADVLSIIPMVKGLRLNRGPRRSVLPNAFGESIRILRNTLLDRHLNPIARTILITSASAGEGKSTVAVSLAGANADQGLRTLLIDLDLKRGSVRNYLAVPQSEGFADILRGEMPWKDAVVEVPDHLGLSIITAGTGPTPTDGIRGQVLANLLKEAAEEYELIILDGPPLPGFADSMQLALLVDGILVVAKAGSTDQRALGTVFAMLDRLNARILGVVLNQTQHRVSAVYYPKAKPAPRTVQPETVKSAV